MNRITQPATAPVSLWTSIPSRSRRRLVSVGAGWVSSAVCQAVAAALLALAIMNALDPMIVVLSAAGAAAVVIIVSRAGYLSGARLAGELYAVIGDAFATARLSWFSEANRQLTASVASQRIPQLMGVPAHQLQTFIVSPLLPLLIAGSTCLLFEWQEGVALAALLIVAWIVQYGAQRGLRRADRARHDAEHLAAAASLELVEHLELLRSGAGSARALDRFDAGWSAQTRAATATSRAASLATIASAFAHALPMIGVVLMITLSGAFTSAETLALLILTLTATAPLEGLALAAVSWGDLRATAKDFGAVVTAPALDEPTAPIAVPTSATISLNQVSTPPVLRRISATIPPGSRTHISGETGTGKSTLLELIMRFADPEDGEIRFGTQAVTAFDSSDYQRRFAYVPQDPVVFGGTLAANIRVGAPDASDADVRAAAEHAQLQGVIARSPEGLEQEIGHQGGLLSGGERQRVAIARALVSAAPILVLDEATSALDAETERRVASAVIGLTRTVIIVTHGDASLWQPTDEIRLAHPGSR